MGGRAPQQTPNSVLPIPAKVILPPPLHEQGENPSAASSSRRKRKRKLDDAGNFVPRTFPEQPLTIGASSVQSSIVWASIASDFSNALEARVRAISGDRCWHCRASPVNICHVIGSRDNTFETAIQDGLIDILDKHHPHNAIALCGTCRSNFDDPYNANFFFLPTDLNYFLKFEQKDRKRRRRIGHLQGTIPIRICPTAQMYQDYQARMGMQVSELSGGLYTRLVFNDFLPIYPGRGNFVPGHSEYGATEPWPGSPMAALLRAITMLQKFNLAGIPHDVIGDLRALQDIYSKPINLDVASDGTLDSVSYSDTGRIAAELGDDVEAICSTNVLDTHEHGADYEQNRNFRAYTKCKDQNDEMGSDQSAILSQRPEAARPESACSWCWGPKATSQDAIRFFRNVIF